MTRPSVRFATSTLDFEYPVIHKYCRLFSVRCLLQRASLSVDLLVPEDMSNLPDDKPHGEDSDGPKTKVEVDVSDRSHDRHAAEAILQRLGQ